MIGLANIGTVALATIAVAETISTVVTIFQAKDALKKEKKVPRYIGLMGTALSITASVVFFAAKKAAFI